VNENQNGRCPACRQTYKTENYKFSPPLEDLSKVRAAQPPKKLKGAVPDKKFLDSNARKQLANVRVIQRNLVYITNLALSAAKEETLRKTEYFGKFGKIIKTIVNRNNIFQGPQGPSVSAYVTYFQNRDAYSAIKATDGTIKDGRLLRASFGTTKYCSYFLRNTRCPNPDCMYLHDLGRDIDSFTKEDMAQGKHLLSNMTNVTPDGDLINPGLKHSQDTFDHDTPGQKLKAWNTVVATELVTEPKSTALSLNPSEWPDASISQKPSKRKQKLQTGKRQDSDQDDSLDESQDEMLHHRIHSKPQSITPNSSTIKRSSIDPSLSSPSPSPSPKFHTHFKALEEKHLINHGSGRPEAPLPQAKSFAPQASPPISILTHKQVPQNQNHQNNRPTPTPTPPNDSTLPTGSPFNLRESPNSQSLNFSDWMEVLQFDELVGSDPTFQQNTERTTLWSNFQPFGCTSRSRFGFAQDPASPYQPHNPCDLLFQQHPKLQS